LQTAYCKKHLLATGLSFIIHVAIVYTIFFENIFKTTTLRLKDWIIIFGFSSLIFVIAEVIKCFKKKEQ